ncbi:polyprotein, partial [Nerine yellow stripe virus]
GNNSGQPSTVVDNTLMVVIAMQYSLLLNGIELEQQDSVCKYFANGDDLLIAIEPTYATRLFDSFECNFKQLGLNYDFSNRVLNKEELIFMSHKGVLVDGLYIPKLERERIVSILEWDKSSEPEQRLEAICASMIEAWGYKDLLYEIRKFYAWVLEQAPYSELARNGKAPYLAETALRHLYTNSEIRDDELLNYIEAFQSDISFDEEMVDVIFQSQETFNAGTELARSQQAQMPVTPSQDVNVGTSGQTALIQSKMFSKKLRVVKAKGKTTLNLEHLLHYKPIQEDLFNTKSSQQQFDNWHMKVQEAYDVDDKQMEILMNGLIVWCIENGTSSELKGTWRMDFGDQQVEYDIQPLIQHSQPTFRQIMRHFSKIAEAYIAMRNQEERYMPRYALQRGLTDISLARYGFDFFDTTAATPQRAREAVMQMKAAAVRGKETRLFSLDGNISVNTENTERHTVEDVTQDMHSLLGVRGIK